MKIDPNRQPQMILVACEAASHATKQNVVQDFTFIGDWSTDDKWQAGSPIGVDGTFRGRRGNSMVWMEENARIADGDSQAFARPTEKRIKYDMKCKLCGLSVSVRHETIEPVLNALREVGVSQVSLARIASMISKS